MAKLLVIPSIDIMDGKTVRIVQGIPELGCSAYGNDPVEMAMIWRAENAKCLHVVDFNASWHHSHTNDNVIRKICESGIIPVELGGGIISFEDAQLAFDQGVARVVIGSLAIDNPKEFEKILSYFTPNKVVAAIDVINNEVVMHGRKHLTGVSAEYFAQMLRAMGVERYIVTDVRTNGMLLGPNIELSKKIAEITQRKVTHSGGISGYQDLIRLQKECEGHIDSVIIGRALYENRFSCQKIWRLAETDIF